MLVDINAKSSELLERLANSIYDRNPKSGNPLFFSIKEIHIVESWFKDTLEEALKKLDE